MCFSITALSMYLQHTNAGDEAHQDTQNHRQACFTDWEQ